jgi:uncharacterized membrane protein
MLLGILLGLFAAICYGLSPVVSKFSLKKLPSSIVTIVILTIVTLVSGVLAFSTSELTYSFSIVDIINLIFAGIMGFLALWGLYKSFSYLEVPQSVSFSQIYIFLTYLLSILFLETEFSILILFIMCLVLIGIFFVFETKLSTFFSKGLLYLGLTLLGWGFYAFYLTYFNSKGLNGYYSIFFVESSILIINIIMLLFTYSPKKLISYYKYKKELGFAIISGVLTFCGAYLYLLSTTVISIGIAVAILSTQVLISYIFSVISFKQKIKLNQIIGILLICTGITLFALFS